MSIVDHMRRLLNGYNVALATSTNKPTDLRMLATYSRMITSAKASLEDSSTKMDVNFHQGKPAKLNGEIVLVDRTNGNLEKLESMERTPPPVQVSSPTSPYVDLGAPQAVSPALSNASSYVDLGATTPTSPYVEVSPSAGRYKYLKYKAKYLKLKNSL